jgi:NhaA family Na+:H+ antiporter
LLVASYNRVHATPEQSMNDNRQASPHALAQMGNFLSVEAAAGMALVLAMVLAMGVANSPLSADYLAWLDSRWQLGIAPLALGKTVLHWINDGLMAVFFLVIGLELKRELVEGQFSDPAQVALPVACAVGGMFLPMAVYALFNLGDEAAMRGIAIPAATDIAFALGIMALLGPRVPLALKMLLMAIAVADDLGAIVLIALFYTADLSWLALALASVALMGLVLLNRFGVVRLWPYLLVGALLWLAVLKSGVHATLAGVAIGLSIPMAPGGDGHEKPLERLLHGLHPWVAFGILPLFAFANAGVPLDGLGLDSFLQPVPLGIAAGLLLGKQLGVFGAAWLLVRAGWAKLPDEVSWASLYGVALLCGIGFTMSLFIGSLAFGPEQIELQASHRIGILGGSFISAIAGLLLLWRVLPASRR